MASQEEPSALHYRALDWDWIALYRAVNGHRGARSNEVISVVTVLDACDLVRDCDLKLVIIHEAV